MQRNSGTEGRGLVEQCTKETGHHVQRNCRKNMHKGNCRKRYQGIVDKGTRQEMYEQSVGEVWDIVQLWEKVDWKWEGYEKG